MVYMHTNENDEEFIWNISYTPSYHIPASFYGDPEQWHDGDNSDIEITEVINSLGQDIVQSLDKKTIDDIKQACTEDMEMQSEY